MKWFQVDSDTPNDPKIRALIRTLGTEGDGSALLAVVLHRQPWRASWLVDRHRAAGRFRSTNWSKPASSSQVKFDELSEIVSSWTFRKVAVEKRNVIAIPAMERRADTYTRRRVRTRFEQSTTNVEECSSTRQDIPSTTNTPLTPLAGGRMTRAEKKRAEEILKIRFGRCQHNPACANRNACIAAVVDEIRSKAAAS
jgi:hypothetical protein